MEIGTKFGLKPTGGYKQYEIVAAGAGVADLVVAALTTIGDVAHAILKAQVPESIPQEVVAGEDFERDDVPPRPDGTPRIGRVKPGQVIKYRLGPKLDQDGRQVILHRTKEVTLVKPVASLAAIGSKKSAKKESTEASPTVTATACYGVADAS